MSKKEPSTPTWMARLKTSIGIALVCLLCIGAISAALKNKEKEQIKTTINDAVTKVKIHTLVETTILGPDSTISSVPKDINSSKSSSSSSDSSSSSSEPEANNGLTSYLDSIKTKKENGDLKDIEIIEILSSNKIKIKNKGKEEEARLIGVSGNGDKDALKALIDISEKISIEQDTRKTEGGKLLIYLWGDDRMINLEMVATGSANCSYNPGSNIIEQPNIKYFGEFIDASKAATN